MAIESQSISQWKDNIQIGYVLGFNNAAWRFTVDEYHIYNNILYNLGTFKSKKVYNLTGTLTFDFIFHVLFLKCVF